MTRRRRVDLTAIAVATALVAGLLLARNLVVPEPLERLAHEDGEYQGSWHFPRGGPFILGFESPGPATLAIDGAVIARGQGERTVRRVYQPGAHAVRFEAPAGARLLWHPPGRRGPLEYVPPSSLSPAPPELARFGAGAGASRTDGAFALAIVLVLAGLILFLVRDGLRRIDRTSAIAFAAVFVPALLIRLHDLGAAGQTWDEDVNWSAGRNYITNLLSLDFRLSSWRWNLEHPPVMKYVAGLGAQLADGYGPARALSAIMMALACALMVPIGRRLFPADGLRIGVVAGIACALTPHLIAHGKVVGHEAPSLLLWMLLLWAALRVADGAHPPPNPPPASGRRANEEHAARAGDTTADAEMSRMAGEAAPNPLSRASGGGAGWGPLQSKLLLIGILFGLALSARFINALAAPLVAAVVLARAPAGQRTRVLAWGAAIIPIAALLTAVLIWPRLWTDPIAHLQESWAVLRKPHSAEPYLGTITNQPPASYFLRYLLATAPLALLIGAALWIPRALSRRELGSLLLLAWLAAPLIVTLSPVRQDGVRYILPSVAALSMAAAAGLLWLADLISRQANLADRWRRWIGAAIAAAFISSLAVAAARIHPYYLDYYGEHEGGTFAVAQDRRFEVAWWGEGLAEALAVINERAAPGARVHKGCVEPSHLAWLRGDLWASEVRDPARADWILIYQPAWRDCPVPPGFELAHEVTAAGAPLARVYRRVSIPD